MMSPELIQIDETYLKQIKSVLAYPIDTALLQVFTPEYIKEYALYPAMVDYFKKFPKYTEYQTRTSGYQEFQFPDTFTFGFTDARHVNKEGSAEETAGGFSMFQMMQWQAVSGGQLNGNTNRWGSRYNFNGVSQAVNDQRQLYTSLIEDLNTFNITLNQGERKVQSYASAQCDIYIKWAKNSNEFNDIAWQFRQDVIELTKANLLKNFARFAGITSNSDSFIGIDVGMLKEEAREMEEAVKSRWNEIIDVISMNLS